MAGGNPGSRLVLIPGTFDRGDLEEVAKRRAMGVVPFFFCNEQLATRNGDC